MKISCREWSTRNVNIDDEISGLRYCYEPRFSHQVGIISNDLKIENYSMSHSWSLRMMSDSLFGAKTEVKRRKTLCINSLKDSSRCRTEKFTNLFGDFLSVGSHAVQIN